jgi:hypothetical protein
MREETRWRCGTSRARMDDEGSASSLATNIRSNGISRRDPTGRPAADVSLRSGEHCIARPWWIRDPEQYRMWFAVRGRPVSIGYAESTDGNTGRAPTMSAACCRSARGGTVRWSSTLHDRLRGRRYMLYNGNRYGRTGVGLGLADCGGPAAMKNPIQSAHLTGREIHLYLGGRGGADSSPATVSSHRLAGVARRNSGAACACHALVPAALEMRRCFCISSPADEVIMPCSRSSPRQRVRSSRSQTGVRRHPGRHAQHGRIAD